MEIIKLNQQQIQMLSKETLQDENVADMLPNLIWRIENNIENKKRLIAYMKNGIFNKKEVYDTIKMCSSNFFVCIFNMADASLELQLDTEALYFFAKIRSDIISILKDIQELIASIFNKFTPSYLRLIKCYYGIADEAILACDREIYFELLEDFWRMEEYALFESFIKIADAFEIDIHEQLGKWLVDKKEYILAIVQYEKYNINQQNTEIMDYINQLESLGIEDGR